MPRYLNTLGKPSVAIAVCDRCNAKVAYSDLRPDGNSPGLRVCEPCRDTIDPYKLPIPRQEKVSLRFPRPDVALSRALTFLTTESGDTLTAESGAAFEPEGDYAIA